MLDWTRYPNFSLSEMACRCGCGKADMDPRFLEFLQRLRRDFGAPMPVSSGYRCPAHNVAESHTGEAGPHTTGRAVDIAVRGPEALRLIALAYSLGCRRVGVKQEGDRRFVHLDLCDDDAHPPALWSY